MAKLVYRMNVSLDGYVDHDKMTSSPTLFRHWIDQVRSVAAGVYGRRIYDLMRYWDDDKPEWTAAHHDFAAAWRNQPKWVASRSLTSPGPNTMIVASDLEAVVRDLKARLDGEISVSGPVLAGSLTDAGLIDTYELYLQPVVLGRGNPFFAGPRPPLRFVAVDPIDDHVVRLTYEPA